MTTTTDHPGRTRLRCSRCKRLVGPGRPCLAHERADWVWLAEEEVKRVVVKPEQQELFG